MREEIRTKRKPAQYYLKAATQNHIGAQVNLSVMYAKGRGVRRDEAPKPPVAEQGRSPWRS